MFSIFRFNAPYASLPAVMLLSAVAGFSAAAESFDLLLVEGSEVRRYSEDGVFIENFAEHLNAPLAIARSEPHGFVFIGEHDVGVIRKYRDDGEELGQVLSGHSEWLPTGLAWNNGRLYAGSLAYNSITSYAPDPNEEDGDSNTPEPQIAVQLSEGVSGLCSAGERGGVYFTTSDDSTGRGSLGYWSGIAGDAPATLATFDDGSKPRGVAVEGGAFYVALMGENKVVTVDESGIIEDWLTDLAMPVGLGVHDGELYVSQYSDRTLRTYVLSDKSETISLSARHNPQYFTFAPSKSDSSVELLPTSSDDMSLEENSPKIHIRADLESFRLPVISWDTEERNRARINLLLAPVTLSAQIGGERIALSGRGQLNGTNEVVYRFISNDATIMWTVSLEDALVEMNISGSGEGLSELQNLELTFPFDPRAAATGPVGGEWTSEGKLRLPSLLHAPDLGSLRISSSNDENILCRWEGSRGRVDCWATLTVELPSLSVTPEVSFVMEAYHLPQPDGLKDAKLWNTARSGWMNLLQTSTKRPTEAGKVPCPAGVWANNIISDPVAATLSWLADHVLMQPELAPDITATSLLRRSLDLYINGATSAEGEVAYVWNDGITSDTNPSLIIGAWAYVESTGDVEWYVRNRDKLALVAGFMEKRDIDGDGLFESRATGNRGLRTFGDSAWDVIASGHKNAYINALVFRAWRCMAKLEEKVPAPNKAAHYTALADKLKKAYRETFFNPETGWLAWWRSEDGELIDLWSDMPTSLAIASGLLTPEDGGKMLDRHWEELQKTGFKQFDVGIPLNLRPIPPSLMMAGYGGKEEDGSDTFGRYLNGGACVSNAGIWLLASYIAGRGDRADMVLEAMLQRQSEGPFANGGGFQNGIIDRAGAGAEFFDWEGNTTGYEGHLVYSWVWMQSLFAREGIYQEKAINSLIP